MSVRLVTGQSINLSQVAKGQTPSQGVTQRAQARTAKALADNDLNALQATFKSRIRGH